MSVRSPIIFWLLLAATISVDAVIFPLVASNSSSPFLAVSLYVKLAFDALILSQVNVVCIWAALSSKKILWIPVIVAVATAALFGAQFGGSADHLIDGFKLYLGLYGLDAALLIMGLWLLRASQYWRRRTGVAHDLQYSLAHLLVVMTVAAVLMATLRNSLFQGDGKWASIGFVGSVVVLALASVVFWSLPWHWLLRLAATLGLAILLAAVFCLAADFPPPFAYAFVAHYLIQAIVLSAWIGWGQILPLSLAAVEREPQKA